MIGRQMEDLEMDNERLGIRLELEEKAKQLTNCSDLADLTENLDSLLQIRMKKTSRRPSNSFDEFKSTLERIRNVLHITSQTPTKSPIPAEKWKPRSTKAPRMIPVAVETEYEKQQRNGVIYDRVQFKAERAKKRELGKKTRKVGKSSLLGEVRFPLIDLKLAAFGREPQVDREHSFNAQFDLNVSDTLDKETVKTLLQMQLADLFSGYNLDVKVDLNRISIAANRRDGESGELSRDVVTTMIKLLPHFLQEAYAVPAQVSNINVTVVNDKPEIQTVTVGNPVSLQLLEHASPQIGPVVSLKTTPTAQAQAGLDRHNLLRDNHVNTPLLFHDETLCRSARNYATKLASGDGSIKHDFAELVRLGHGENLFSLEATQGKLCLTIFDVTFF